MDITLIAITVESKCSSSWASSSGMGWETHGAKTEQGSHGLQHMPYRASAGRQVAQQKSSPISPLSSTCDTPRATGKNTAPPPRRSSKCDTSRATDKSAAPPACPWANVRQMSRHARAQPHLPVLQAHDKPRQSVHRHIRLQGKQPQTGARGLQVRWCDAAISQQAWRAWAWQQAAPPCRMSAPAAERCRAAAPGATTENAAQRPSISCSPAAGRCRAAAPCRCTWSAPPPGPR